MKEKFGILPTGDEASLYTISCGALSAAITDCGATLVRLLVPDRDGNVADVVLGFDDAASYCASGTYFGATVGRNANRVHHARFPLGNSTVTLQANDGPNNLHSGPDGYQKRLWQVESHTNSSITLRLDSPHNDQGFPGNAVIRVCYILEPTQLRIRYEAVSDRDTVFNLTNHSYFNLAGHDKVQRALEQHLTLPGRHFLPCDAETIPTGELRPVAGTPFDFRKPKAIGRDIHQDDPALVAQHGYDHNWEVFCNPCAILHDPSSGRCMSIYTDRPGIQVYSGNYLDEPGKDDVYYSKGSGIALETQFYPDSVNHPQWLQPFTKAGNVYRSETRYVFACL